MRAGRPWNLMRSRAMSSQLCRCWSSGISSFTLASVLIDVLRIAGKRRPAERADAAAEQRADIGRHKARKIEGVLEPLILRHLADVVAVVERRHAHLVKCEHRAHVIDHRALRGFFDRLGIALALRLPLAKRPARRQIAVDRIMRRGLIGDDIGPHAAARPAPEISRPHCRARRPRPASGRGSARSMTTSASSRSFACHVEIAGAQAASRCGLAGIRRRAARRRP